LPFVLSRPGRRFYSYLHIWLFTENKCLNRNTTEAKLKDTLTNQLINDDNKHDSCTLDCLNNNNEKDRTELHHPSGETQPALRVGVVTISDSTDTVNSHRLGTKIPVEITIKVPVSTK